MKKLLIIAIGLVTLASCEKLKLFDKNHKDKPCPTVSADAVPSAVSTAFQAKYPGITAEKWFNKDNTGYCALSTINGKKMLSQFDNNGNFQKEEIDGDNNQQGNHQDGGNDNEGCDCETGD